jgi:hypothetical protein
MDHLPQRIEVLRAERGNVVCDGRAPCGIVVGLRRPRPGADHDERGEKQNGKHATGHDRP